MFCSNCGKELSEDMKFCPNCGNKIAKSTQLQSPSNQQNNENSKGISFHISLDFIFCIIIPLFLLIIFLWSHLSVLSILSICNIFFVFGGLLALQNIKKKNFFSWFSIIIFSWISVISVIIHSLSILYKLTSIKRFALFENGSIPMDLCIIISLIAAFVLGFINYKKSKEFISKINIPFFILYVIFRILNGFSIL